MSRFDVALELPIGAASPVEIAIASDARVIAIVGPSGIGKSTLLRAIAGLHPSLSPPGARGRVAIAGVALDRLAPEARGIGWAPQESLLFPHLSVRDNVAFPRADREALERAVALTGIAPLLDRAPATLSGGERQRVALARALARAPRVLLLDEPFAALDRSARTVLAGALREHVDAHDVSTVLVAHDESDVRALAGDVLVMSAEGLRREEVLSAP